MLSRDDTAGRLAGPDSGDKGRVPFCCEDSANWTVPNPAGGGGDRFGRPPDWFPWAAAIGRALPTLNCLQRGQVGMVQLYLLLLGFRLLVTTAVRQTGGRRTAIGTGRLDSGSGRGDQGDARRLPVGLLFIERLVAARSPSVTGRSGKGRERFGRTDRGVRHRYGAVAVVVPASAIGWQRNLDCLARWCSLVPTKAIDTARICLPAIRTACAIRA